MIRTVISAFILIWCIYTFSTAQEITIAPDTLLSDSLSVEGSSEDPLTEAAPLDNAPKTPVSKNYIKASADSSWWYRKIENKAFGVGESLEFSVKYGSIPAGTAVIQIPELVEYESRLCYKVVSTAHSNDVISVFYRVRDTVETVIDYNGIFPRKFRKHLKEGGYEIDRTTYFDQRRHLAITGNDTIPTYAFVQDAFSSLYYARTQELIPGKAVMIDNHTDRKNFPLKLEVYKKERIKVPAGEFDCIVVEPVMRAEGIFKAKGRIWIWLTDDQYRIPVMMKTEVFILGSVTAKLKSYTLGQTEETVE